MNRTEQKPELLPNATIHDVARKSGVSISTVSRVINGSAPVGEPVRQRVLDAIEKTGYLPHKSARTLKNQKTGVVGIVVPDISNPFFCLLVRGCENAARSQGYSALICDTNNDLETEDDYLDLLRYERVEGVVLTTVSTHGASDPLAKLLQRSIPLVAADRRLEHPAVSTVLSDSEQDGRLLAEHLLGLGYRSFVFLAGPEQVSTARERLAGFRDVIEGAGVPLEVVTLEQCDYTFESGYEAVELLGTARLPGAVVAANDLMALGAKRALEDSGVSLPADVGLAGFDHIPMSDWTKPRLTTVEIPAYDIGWEAMTLLVRSLSDGEAAPAKVTVPSQLVEGESTRRQP